MDVYTQLIIYFPATTEMKKTCKQTTHNLTTLTLNIKTFFSLTKNNNK